MSTGAVRAEAGSVLVSVRLTPRAAHDRIDGLETLSNGTEVLAARVRAVPEKGAANAALEKLVAGALGLPKRDVSLVAGGTARVKTLRIVGDPDDLTVRLVTLCS